MENESFMTRFISFERFLTPMIIKIIFYIGVAICMIIGLYTIFGGSGGFFGRLVFGLLTMILGPILVKIYCELVIVLFQIYEVLVDIKKSKSQ